MKFSNRLNIPPSETIEINSLALQKKKKGERIYNLSIGEVVTNTSNYIIRSAEQAMKENKSFYTLARGIKELREVSRNWINKSYNTNFSFEETFVTNGGKFALYSLCQAILNPGDEAIVIAPYWVSYPSMIKLAEGKPVILETRKENDWKVAPAQIEEAISEKTKFIIFNNASNPTGVFYEEKEVRNILEVAKRNNVLVISDEVYSGLVYDEKKYVSCGMFPEYKDNVVVVHSASKIFSMTGWRVGFVFAQKEIVDVLAKLQGQSTSNTCSIAQWAAVGAFDNADKIIVEVQRKMQKRRDLFVKTFNELFLCKIKPPLSALYCFVPIKCFGVENNNSVEFCKKVLEESNVALVPGSAFGMEGFVRCSFGVNEEEIVEAIKKLYEYFK